MGMGMKSLEYLSEKGYFEKKCAILDIGSQCLLHAAPESIRAFVEKHGRIAEQAALEKEINRISYFSWPRPGERTSYLSELLDLTILDYTSYDICPAIKTQIFDMNEDVVSAKHRDYFDIVLNFGTTEHIFNQANSFRVMHDALRVGGIFFHQVPSVGYNDHGFFCYHNCFFENLAKSNDYEIVDLWYYLSGQASLDGADIRNVETPEIPRSGICAADQLMTASFVINVILRKRGSQPFGIPLELATSHSKVSPKITKARESGSSFISFLNNILPSPKR